MGLLSVRVPAAPLRTFRSALLGSTREEVEHAHVGFTVHSISVGVITRRIQLNFDLYVEARARLGTR